MTDIDALAACVEEDEHAAVNALRPQTEGEPLIDGIAVRQVVHICKHPPLREAAEVALKRLILREHIPMAARDYSLTERRWVEIQACEACSMDPGPGNDAEASYERWPCEYIKAMEAIYAEGS